MKKIREIMKNEDGQGMVEYGLILGLIAVAAVVALVALGPKIKDLFQGAADALPTGSTAS